MSENSDILDVEGVHFWCGKIFNNHILVIDSVINLLLSLPAKRTLLNR